MFDSKLGKLEDIQAKMYVGAMSNQYITKQDHYHVPSVPKLMASSNWSDLVTGLQQWFLC